MRMRKFLNWLNGTKDRRGASNVWGRAAIEPLPQGGPKSTTYKDAKMKARVRPLSEKIKAAYREGRDGVLKEFNDD